MKSEKVAVNSMLFSLQDVGFSYPKSEGHDEVAVFKNISIAIGQGELVLVAGPSGGGKTTFLRLLCMMEEPARGKLFFDGQPYEAIYPPDLRRQAVMVPQTPIMFPGNVRDNLTLCANHAEESTMADWMQRLGLDPALLERPAAALSVGQQQRVAVIRAIMAEPRALLLDEPTAALDPDSAARFVEAIARLNRERGVTVVWNSHRSGELESIATRTLRAGRELA
ncbi:MAG: ATP-binding cassette domain-containing protein [Nitrospinae bacterium]|nr:ATP-binding cassette domain-containing protein [Nitrospinota bacterium]